MLYNDDKFGKIKDAQERSLYNRSTQDSPPIPPPGELFLIDNDVNYLIDNDGNYLIEVNP
jgi:hypothetical protein